MGLVDYSQTSEDHQSFLVLVQHTGQKLSSKHFTRLWERIHQLACVAIPGQKRDMWIRYKRQYLKESNEWGDFQAHRKVLGLICLGRCSNEAEFDELFESYRQQKESYSGSLFNSRLMVVGMNTDGSPLSEEQKKNLEKASSPPPLTMKIDDQFDFNSDGGGGGVKTDRKSEKRVGKVLSGEKVEKVFSEETSAIVNEGKTLSNSKSAGSLNSMNSTSNQRTHSNSLSKEGTGSEVVFYPSTDNTDSLEEKVREFVTSLFFVLEGKRLDRSFERSDRMQLLCAPFEKKDYVGVDTDTKSFRKKCQGRLRKHLADLCLQAGLPGEAMLHYNTAMDILRPVNDYLWMGACFEGLCSASVVLTFPRTQLSGTTGLRRNQSFSLKRGVAAQQDSKFSRSGSVIHSYANGLQDLPETAVKSCLNPDDIIEKYKEALVYYSKYKNAGMIEMEASLKACRVLIAQRKYLQASDFLQNVVYIDLQISDEDKISRYGTLSSLYAEIGFQRKASFYKRVAAMQCVAPQNPKQNWLQCYNLLLQVLDGYKISLAPREMVSKSGIMTGWPVIQTRVLHELVYSARRMGNIQLAIRHLTLLLHVLLDYLSPQEKREITSTLETLTSTCEGTAQPLALETGAIAPPVPLTNVPTVKSFKPMSLHPHLEPRSMTASTESSTNVFIFTPLSLASSTDSSDSNSCSKMDFLWVEGEMAECQLQVINHMPDELQVNHMGLLTEGVEMETFPASPCISAESGPYLVKIMCRPQAPGVLTILGYTTQVYGVKSVCRLRDIARIPQTQFKVQVVPSLPQIQLTTSLPKAASFVSFGDEANVVTSGTTSIYMGQSIETQVTIQNTGNLSVDEVKVTMEASHDSKNLADEVFLWNKDNIDSQLPLQTSKLICFTVCINGIGDFLVPRPELGSRHDIPNEDLALGSEGRCVEAILRVQYSGGAGLEAGYCRCCSVAYSVDILPSLVFHKWDVLPAESPDTCYLLFDVKNMSGHQVELQYSTHTLLLEQDQLRRIVVQVERFRFPPEPVDPDLPYLKQETRDRHYSQFIATFVDIRWHIPVLNISGKAGVDKLTWSAEQLELLQLSPVSWDVRVNEELYSALRIGAVEVCVGEMVEVEVGMTVKAEGSEKTGFSGVLEVVCCQNCDNGTVSTDLGHQVAQLGCPSLILPQMTVDGSVSHSCSFLFYCCGVYRIDISAKVKGQAGEAETWKCMSVIEVKVND